MAENPIHQNYENCSQEDKIQVMGPDSEHVCLISKDDRFAVKRSHAMTSMQLAGMMTRPGAAEEGEVNKINLTNISTPILKIVREYLDFKVKHTCPDWQDPISDSEIKKEDMIDVLFPVNFLDI